MLCALYLTLLILFDLTALNPLLTVLCSALQYLTLSAVSLSALVVAIDRAPRLEPYNQAINNEPTRPIVHSTQTGQS